MTRTPSGILTSVIGCEARARAAISALADAGFMVVPRLEPLTQSEYGAWASVAAAVREEVEAAAAQAADSAQPVGAAA